eukprot:CAMPEP_0206138232 /NCGR_PEP_ID=MMETSP1473-20131121/3168_1 /ASSEMBLY_ACC=CAM_ASM_001109 /TAXON_ID=1461547 /ORGANISM="Stichococcus sp, Strain RCC1054" /LENGTH=44 /DNA_ID= /DNA_START= /DNA_END= /DNA_ORIENTATION=
MARSEALTSPQARATSRGNSTATVAAPAEMGSDRLTAAHTLPNP